MVAGEILNEEALSEFSYKTVPHNICLEILLGYCEELSVERAYNSSFPLSSATFARVVRAAAEQGIIEMQPQGGLPNKRKRASEEWQKHPNAKVKEIARLAGCREATVYRARVGEDR